MENSYKHQVERIDRLMKIVEADNPHELAMGLLTIDVIMFACQSMWHLKDWILKDPKFGAKDNDEVAAAEKRTSTPGFRRRPCFLA